MRGRGGTGEGGETAGLGVRPAQHGFRLRVDALVVLGVFAKGQKPVFIISPGRCPSPVVVTLAVFSQHPPWAALSLLPTTPFPAALLAHLLFAERAVMTGA